MGYERVWAKRGSTVLLALEIQNQESLSSDR